MPKKCMDYIVCYFMICVWNNSQVESDEEVQEKHGRGGDTSQIDSMFLSAHSVSMVWVRSEDFARCLT